MDVTIDRVGITDFINLFYLVVKYCDKKRYYDFSFNIVNEAWGNCREFCIETFLFIKNKIGSDILY